jgi:hypothetical protein
VRVRLAQPARVTVRVVKAGRVLRTLRNECAPAGLLRARWDGKLGGRAAAPGRYRLRVTIRSDRRPLMRGAFVRLR